MGVHIMGLKPWVQTFPFLMYLLPQCNFSDLIFWWPELEGEWAARLIRRFTVAPACHGLVCPVQCHEKLRSSELQRGDFLLPPRSTSGSLKLFFPPHWPYFKKQELEDYCTGGKLNPEEEPIQTWHLLGRPATAHNDLCLESARALQLPFDLGQQIPQCHEQRDRNRSAVSQLEQCCCFRERQKLWKSGGNPKRTKEMGSKRYHLLTLPAQPQALWAPHADKLML